MLRHLTIGCRHILPYCEQQQSTTQKYLCQTRLLLPSCIIQQRKMSSRKHSIAKRFEGHVPSVWVEFGKLAVETKALNLGQGFPDYMPPSVVTEALKQVANSTNPLVHQYTRSSGNPHLVKALSETYSPLFGRNIDMNEEIVCTVGAYGSLYCAIQGLVNPGDEVIIIEPFFDCYEPMVNVAGGIPVFVPLKPCKHGSVISSADWKLDPEELASKFNSKTKMIVINNPNNPLGKVMTREELEMISELCRKHNVIVVSDEVYEWLVYPPQQHVRIATLPGMWDRTISIGSAGKTFSVTGWKLGWSIGPKDLIHCLRMVHQNCNYTCATPLQEAVAVSFDTERQRLQSPECYHNSIAGELRPKRDKMAKFLEEVGMVPTVPEAGYFMVADFSNLKIPHDEGSSETPDYQFVKWMTVNKKLASIPTSAFYSAEHKHLAASLVRFCFFKEDETLDKAADIMREWKKTLPATH